jgi:hypothetical protein
MQKLAVIVESMNQGECLPGKMMTFRGLIENHRTLKLVNTEATTMHGYEMNIRAR